jgi:DNA-binding transcriptional MerR regulator
MSSSRTRFDQDPEKLFYRIGEVAELLEVAPSVLRFWESQFSQVSPKKAPSGHRVYGRKEVERLFRIRELLYVERFSIEGARKKLTLSYGGRSSLKNLREKLQSTELFRL